MVLFTSIHKMLVKVVAIFLQVEDVKPETRFMFSRKFYDRPFIYNMCVFIFILILYFLFGLNYIYTYIHVNCTVM